jgi:MerR family transcriptional regulator, copper efflux regulator
MKPLHRHHTAIQNPEGLLNIGQASEKTGVSAKMIRYYEEIGLIPPSTRSESGYRLYGEKDLHTLRFIRRARDLGFSMEEIGGLLALWKDRARKSSDVKRLALKHVADLRAKIAELTGMANAIEHLADCCAGNNRPDCPILEELEITKTGMVTAGHTHDHVTQRHKGL